MDKAVAAARKAFPSWRKKTQEDRSSAVSRIAAALSLSLLLKEEIIGHTGHASD